MKKLFPVFIMALCAFSIYSCKEETKDPVITVADPADSFVGNWNTKDTSYYFGVQTDLRNFNFNIIKTAANKISLINFPTTADTTPATVTTSSIVTDDSTVVIHVINQRTWTYKYTPGTFGNNYYFTGKATKL